MIEFFKRVGLFTSTIILAMLNGNQKVSNFVELGKHVLLLESMCQSMTGHRMSARDIRELTRLHHESFPSEVPRSHHDQFV